MLEVVRLSGALKIVLNGEPVTIPCTIGMAKFYRKEIEKYILRPRQNQSQSSLRQFNYNQKVS